jgi:hypothetical protein
MKMAKASEADIESLTDFFNMLEEAIEYGTVTDSKGNSEEVDDEKIAEIIRNAWNGHGRVGCSWRRVIIGCAVLIDNCCDPELSYLDWRPDVRAFLESQPEE